MATASNDEHTHNRLVGYARVSPDDQTTRQQIDELKAAGRRSSMTSISGASTERAGLDACLDTLNQGNALVGVAFDRIGRLAVEHPGPEPCIWTDPEFAAKATDIVGLDSILTGSAAWSLSILDLAPELCIWTDPEFAAQATDIVGLDSI